MEYLIIKRGIEPALARKIVDHCGRRIYTLKEVCDALSRGTGFEGRFQAFLSITPYSIPFNSDLLAHLRT